MLQYQNTPDRDTGLSQAQVLYARKLRNGVLTLLKDLQLRKEWVLLAEARRQALARQHQIQDKVLSEHIKVQKELPVGQVVQVKNQTGTSTRISGT